MSESVLQTLKVQGEVSSDWVDPVIDLLSRQ